ncbi:hypothetical protein N7519_001293 [Penicillium mononematosum]|uniref:uncharacterized protein n=1 Tax=Penicillium mononematosum TaxID=268346 RepID=UPI002549A8B4|nr:uncharacterized protein N7519_001293 [Penicillium mononematosum]KAJ6191272.1 hypothetical protein N7519_001293 [Penicillium mononematosum]
MAESEQRQLAYWQEQLEGSQPAELLCDKPRSGISSGKAQVHHFNLDDQLYQDLQAFCQTHQATPFVVLLAAFRATHYRVHPYFFSVTSCPSCTRAGMLPNQKFPPISETTTCETWRFAQTLEKLFHMRCFGLTFDL